LIVDRFVLGSWHRSIRTPICEAPTNTISSALQKTIFRSDRATTAYHHVHKHYRYAVSTPAFPTPLQFSFLTVQSLFSAEPRMSLANVGTGLPPSMTQRPSIMGETTVKQKSLLSGTFLSSPVSSLSRELMPPLSLGYLVTSRRGRSSSMTEHDRISGGKFSPSGSLTGKKVMSVASASLAKARARNAQKENDAMVYLDGQQIYSCAQCRTHLTSHDDIISKSFHGRNGTWRKS
jgi:hypothetical protein